MNTSTALQKCIAEMLEAPDVLPVSAPVVRRKEKDVENDMEAGLAVQSGLCIFAMPPIPTSALQDVPFVFFDGYELRVRIIEMPTMNGSGADAYQLIDAISLALHWKNPGDMLSYPLALARRPVEMVEGVADAPGFEHHGKFLRIVDVIFNAVLDLNPENQPL